MMILVPLTRRTHRLSRALHVAAALKRAEQDIVHGLRTNGLAVVPNFFQDAPTNSAASTSSTTGTTTMRDEAVHFFDAGRFRISQSTRWNTADPPSLEVYDKSNVYSMSLHHPSDTSTGPVLTKYIDEMGVAMPHLLRQEMGTEITARRDDTQHGTDTEITFVNKLAVCTGDGSGYEPHIDNNGTDGRKLTAILYLNPSWEATQGGQFRIHSPLVDRTISPLVDPLAGTLVLFWSDGLLHSTLPCLSDNPEDHRYALTLWFSF